MTTVAETHQSDPVFDPVRVGESLDVIQAQLPVHDQHFSGTVVGEFASRRKGAGYDIDGLRDYVLGDDTRHIDWRATARQPSEWPQIREHYTDNMPSLWVVTDAPQSRNRTNPGYFSEQNLALSAVTGLMRIAHLEGMASAVIASDDSDIIVPKRMPVQGKNHLLRMAETLSEAVMAESPEQSEQRLADLIKYSAERCTDSVVAIVSDFRDVADPNDPDHGWKASLEELAHRGNQLVAVEITNPYDFKLPETVDRLATKDKVMWIGSDKQGQKRRGQYEAAAAEQQAAIDLALSEVDAHHIKLSTAQPKWLASFAEQLRR